MMVIFMVCSFTSRFFRTFHNHLVKKRKIIWIDISNYTFQNNRNIKVQLKSLN